jgi:hypothetical protein
MIGRTRPAGANTAWNNTMFTVIGANNNNAKGTNLFDNNKSPTKTSIPLINGNMYPVAAKAPAKAPAASGIGGAGKKFKNPFNPNTKKIKPNKRRAIIGSLDMRTPFVYNLTCFIIETLY